MGDAPALHHRSSGARPPPRQARASEQCNDDHTLSSGTRAKPAARTHALLQWATKGDRGITYVYRGTTCSQALRLSNRGHPRPGAEGPSRRVWTPAVRLPPGRAGQQFTHNVQACRKRIGVHVKDWGREEKAHAYARLHTV